jgi:hypothetical protein
VSVRTFISSKGDTSSTSQVDLLRCRSSSGYRNVYFHKRDKQGRDIYVARVKWGGSRAQNLPGSRSPQPRACAQFVVRWYAERFGDKWPEVLQARKVNPFQVRKSKKYGGYVAAVWVEGRREEVVWMKPLKRNKWEVTDWLDVFATREDARRGVWRYLSRRYGLFGAVLLWREGERGTDLQNLARIGENNYTR